MTAYQPGDRVRLTVVAEGVVTERGRWLRTDSGNFYDLGTEHAGTTRTVEVIERALPPEPPEGSIVVTETDRLYRRIRGRWWHQAPNSIIGLTWADFNEEFAPITVLRNGGPS